MMARGEASKLREALSRIRIEAIIWSKDLPMCPLRSASSFLATLWRASLLQPSHQMMLHFEKKEEFEKAAPP